MRDQRWPGDYESISQEFSRARNQEQAGMNAVNQSFANDFITDGDGMRLDPYQLGELEPSWATQLDTVGMQPHAREYLERDVAGLVSQRRLQEINGQIIDHPRGIQFTGRP